MTTIDSNNCIPTGLRVDIMRRSMENKNLLSKKGSIYIGTGEYISVGGEKIYKTKALNPGKAGEVLSNIEGALKYTTLLNSHFGEQNFSSSLTKTFQSFSVGNTPSFKTETYTNFSIKTSNLQENEHYSNLYSADNQLRFGPWTTFFQLTKENGYLSLKCPNPMKHISYDIVHIAGVSNASLSLTGADLYFYLADQNIAAHTAYSFLKRFVAVNTGEVSESSNYWSGWLIPSSIYAAQTRALKEIQRAPFYIVASDTEIITLAYALNGQLNYLTWKSVTMAYGGDGYNIF